MLSRESSVKRRISLSSRIMSQYLTVITKVGSGSLVKGRAQIDGKPMIFDLYHRLSLLNIMARPIFL